MATRRVGSGISVQERDLVLLRGLFESRAMTAAHLAAIYFNGRKEATKKRLQLLKTAGYLANRPRRAFEPAALRLTRRGLQLLREAGSLAEYPRLSFAQLERRACVSELTLRHELAVADVKTAFHVALAEADQFSVAEFTTWPLLNEFRLSAASCARTDVLVKPDGFIRIHERRLNDTLRSHAFFLEVDRATEALNVVADKAACYLMHYRTGGFAERIGARRSDYRKHPFRVLIVCNSPERLNNVAEHLLRRTPPILTMVWLSTLDAVTRDPLSEIWITPKDYRAALSETSFAVDRIRKWRGYRRQTARETFAKHVVRKRAILSPREDPRGS